MAFEGLCAAYFNRQGYTAELTPTTGDQGADIVLRAPDGAVEIVQCKHQAGSVGQPVLRDLVGAMTHFGARRGYLVTSASFSEPARRWAVGKPIVLIDGAQVATWLADPSAPANKATEASLPMVRQFLQQCGRTPWPWLSVRMENSKNAPIKYFANHIGHFGSRRVHTIVCSSDFRHGNLQAALRNCRSGDLLLLAYPETLRNDVRHLVVEMSRTGVLQYMTGRGNERHLERTNVPPVGLILVTAGGLGSILGSAVDWSVDARQLPSGWWSRLVYVMNPAEAAGYRDLANEAYTVEGMLWDLARGRSAQLDRAKRACEEANTGLKRTFLGRLAVDRHFDWSLTEIRFPIGIQDWPSERHVQEGLRFATRKGVAIALYATQAESIKSSFLPPPNAGFVGRLRIWVSLRAPRAQALREAVERIAPNVNGRWRVFAPDGMYLGDVTIPSKA